jgi:hypothetical protein
MATRHFAQDGHKFLIWGSRTAASGMPRTFRYRMPTASDALGLRGGLHPELNS